MDARKLLNLLAKRHKKQFKEYRHLSARQRLNLSHLKRMQSLAERMAGVNKERRRVAKELGIPIVYA